MDQQYLEVVILTFFFFYDSFYPDQVKLNIIPDWDLDYLPLLYNGNPDFLKSLLLK